MHPCIHHLRSEQPFAFPSPSQHNSSIHNSSSRPTWLVCGYCNSLASSRTIYTNWVLHPFCPPLHREAFWSFYLPAALIGKSHMLSPPSPICSAIQKLTTHQGIQVWLILAYQQVKRSIEQVQYPTRSREATSTSTIFSSAGGPLLLESLKYHYLRTMEVWRQFLAVVPCFIFQSARPFTGTLWMHHEVSRRPETSPWHFLHLSRISGRIEIYSKLCCVPLLKRG